MLVKTITHILAKWDTRRLGKNFRSIFLRNVFAHFCPVACVLLSIGLQSKCAGQTLELDRVSQWPGYARGQVYSLSISGNYAYVANAVYGAGLQIVNISNPAAPAFGGVYACNTAAAVAVASNYAYLTEILNGSEVVLNLIDVNNPASPMLVGAFRTNASGANVLVSGNHAYIGAGGFGLQIIDISDPFRISVR